MSMCICIKVEFSETHARGSRQIERKVAAVLGRVDEVRARFCNGGQGRCSGEDYQVKNPENIGEKQSYGVSKLKFQGHMQAK